jgi:hypothetical protein
MSQRTNVPSRFFDIDTRAGDTNATTSNVNPFITSHLYQAGVPRKTMRGGRKSTIEDS